MVLNFGGKHLFISTKHWVQKFEMIILRGWLYKKNSNFSCYSDVKCRTGVCYELLIV
jgi:hypothetical protein